MKPNETGPALAVSATYRIKKFGLYKYQLIKVGPHDIETPVGESNVYGIIASDLSDRMIKELSGG